MSKVNNLSFLSLVGVIFLLPLFFVPTPLVPLGISKIIILGFGAILVTALFLFEALRYKAVSIPRSPILWGALALPAVYILSALLSQRPGYSLFGYALEPGTAASIIILSALFFAAAVFFKDRSRLIKIISAFFLSLSILGVFALLKIISGGSWLTLNTFVGSMGNPVGAWTDLAMAMGILAVVSSFALEMLPLRGITRVASWIAFALAVVLLAIVNFSAAWFLVLGLGVVLFVYFATVEKDESKSLSSRSGAWTSGILVLLALLFIWNPGNLGGAIGNATKVNNIDVRPNISSTLQVSSSALEKNLLLGTGPHTFDSNWYLYRPQNTNQTIFWNVGFLYGFGFLPTAIASVGLLGSIVWVFFLALFLILGVRAVSRGPVDRADRFLVVSTFLVSLFLWLAMFLYVPSMVLLAVAFLFTGLFVGAAVATDVIGVNILTLNRNRLTYFASIILVLALGVGMIAFGKTTLAKMVAVYHFQKAVAYSNQGKSLDEIESELGKAVSRAPADPFWSAVSQIELTRANQAINDPKLDDAKKGEIFRNAISASIAAAQNAITLNPSYQNWIGLGNIYAALVPPPISTDGAYDLAKNAYNQALKLNPESPEATLLIGKLELDKGNIDAARQAIDAAIAKKGDYADAHFILAQLEVNQNNIAKAIKSAETGALLSPGNAGVYFEIGLLKYANKDYAGTALAMNTALSIVPSYANAKYYLGLALDKLGKRADAIKQFEELALSNPGNELVTSALDNLKAGRDALAPKKEVGKQLPISGQ